MNIIVCLKEVINPLHVGPRMVMEDIPELDLREFRSMTNPYDEMAIEEALQAIEQCKNGKITLLTAGPESAEKVLRMGLAIGGDEAVRVWDDDFHGSDSFAIANIISRAAKKIGFDLIFCGYKSIDGGSSQMPAMIAEALEISFAGSVVDIELNLSGQQMVVLRKLERGDREKVICKLPALVSVESGINNPRYPTVPGILNARHADVALINKNDLGLVDDEIGVSGSFTGVETYAPPRPKTKKFSIPDSKLSAADRLKQLMSGGIQDRGGDTLQGEPKKIASSFVNFLDDESIITRKEV
ncbi:MAG: electron transfer flavoprotein subunit beta/FixA family protein [Desulfobacterales bacterium]|jgi:electron transfer flavoprotein beta subunit|nr:electron transfer flavoprotein subunit beta/FixA family protein [Desulfobacterales bacterium]